MVPSGEAVGMPLVQATLGFFRPKAVQTPAVESAPQPIVQPSAMLEAAGRQALSPVPAQAAPKTTRKRSKEMGPAAPAAESKKTEKIARRQGEADGVAHAKAALDVAAMDQPPAEALAEALAEAAAPTSQSVADAKLPVHTLNCAGETVASDGPASAGLASTGLSGGGAAGCGATAADRHPSEQDGEPISQEEGVEVVAQEPSGGGNDGDGVPEESCALAAPVDEPAMPLDVAVPMAEEEAAPSLMGLEPPPAAPASQRVDGLSEYEKQRAENIARNNQVLVELGLMHDTLPPPPPRPLRRREPRAKNERPPLRPPSGRVLRQRGGEASALGEQKAKGGRHVAPEASSDEEADEPDADLDDSSVLRYICDAAAAAAGRGSSSAEIGPVSGASGVIGAHERPEPSTGGPAASACPRGWRMVWTASARSAMYCTDAIVVAGGAASLLAGGGKDGWVSVFATTHEEPGREPDPLFEYRAGNKWIGGREGILTTSRPTQRLFAGHSRLSGVGAGVGLLLILPKGVSDPPDCTLIARSSHAHRTLIARSSHA